MKLGLGLSLHQLDEEHCRFARQCGCKHLLVRIADACSLAQNKVREASSSVGYACSQTSEGAGDPCTYDALARLTEQANAAGLQLEAVDHRDPALCLGALLDSPRRVGCLERLKRIIRDVGRVGIPVFLYHVAPVEDQERVRAPLARGGAVAARVKLADAVEERGAAYPRRRPRPSARAWSRLPAYLNELLSVAEGVGVTLAMPFDEAFLPGIRGSMRENLGVHTHEDLINLLPSTRHGFVFDVANSVWAGGDVYGALEACCREKRVACVRLGNVSLEGDAATEAFLDEGSLDVRRIMRILQRFGFTGLGVPGDMPRMNCPAPWHAGVAHAVGYLRAAWGASLPAED